MKPLYLACLILAGLGVTIYKQNERIKKLAAENKALMENRLPYPILVHEGLLGDIEREGLKKLQKFYADRGCNPDLNAPEEPSNSQR